ATIPTITATSSCMISKPATLTGKRKRSGPPRGPPVLWWRSWLGTSTSSPVRFTLPTSNGNMPRNGPNNNTFQMQPALFMHSRRCTMRWCPIALRRVLPLTAAWLSTDLQLPFPMPLSHWHSAAKPVRLCRKPNTWHQRFRRTPQLSTTARYLEERGFRLHSLAGSKARAGSSEMMLCSPLLSDPVCESKGLPPHQKKEGGEQIYKSLSAYRTS